MNVEGDFRYVDGGAFDECLDFFEYMNECGHDWEEAFVSWVGVSNRSRDQKISQSSWGPWSLVKVHCISHSNALIVTLLLLSCFFYLYVAVFASFLPLQAEIDYMSCGAWLA